MIPADDDLDDARLKAAVATLIEHFDTVQIFATRYEGGEGNGTTMVFRGRGDYYARYGAIKRWVLEEEQSDIEDDQEN